MKPIDFPKKMTALSEDEIRLGVNRALEEDLAGIGDVTSLSTLDGLEDHIVRAEIIAKEDGVISGLFVAQIVFEVVSEEIQVELLKTDGDEVKNRDIVMKISGPSQKILTAERTALNFLGLMSGVSTKARKAQNSIIGMKLSILDTRKTLPGLRNFQKYAVYKGCGTNHRIGLYDMVLIKENHIRAAGGLETAVSKARRMYPDLVIELEVETLDEVHRAMKTDADILMLDNMSNETMSEALNVMNGEKYAEASGNITPERLPELAKLGIDFVSMGALTHTVKPLDLSLLIR